MGKNITFGELEIRHLNVADSAVLSAMLLSNSDSYQQYFRPFSFDEPNLRNILSRAQKDKYWGVWVGQTLGAFFMLRGFDEGFAIPSYGVNVSEEFAGRGISLLTLHYVIAWCAVNHVDAIMLKVHPDNAVAKRQYEKIGFKQTGQDRANGNLVYHYSVKRNGGQRD